jgi:hypothetical protein
MHTSWKIVVVAAAAMAAAACGPRFGGFEGDPNTSSNGIDDDVDGAADCADPGCDGPCDLVGCTNFLDYFAKTGTSVPMGTPCATFAPAALGVSGALGTQSANRVAYGGGGAAGLASDWALATSTR